MYSPDALGRSFILSLNSLVLVRAGILNAMEFVQMDKDIRFFDLRYSSVSFKILPPAQPNSDPKYMTCSLIVKGANENRPMINIGDFIRFRPVGEDLLAHCLPMLELEAVVTGFTLKSEKVTCVLALPNMEQTYLNHPPAFPHHAVKVLSELRFHIRFTFDKCGVAFVQKAIDTISESTALKLRVFPPKEREVRNPLPRLLQFPGRIIMDPDLNREQREAVETVSALYLAGVDSYKADRNCTPSPPYIIFGPPGTGKTKTLVSVIRGLVAVGRAEGRHPRVLACAPSDAGVLSASPTSTTLWWCCPCNVVYVVLCDSMACGGAMLRCCEQRLMSFALDSPSTLPLTNCSA